MMHKFFGYFCASKILIGIQNCVFRISHSGVPRKLTTSGSERVEGGLVEKKETSHRSPPG
jgi:hypothetical protein